MSGGMIRLGLSLLIVIGIHLLVGPTVEAPLLHIGGPLILAAEPKVYASNNRDQVIRERLKEETGLSLSLIAKLLTKAIEYDIPAEYVLALFEKESGFNPSAVNKRSGASGLGQFLPKTARWLAKRHNLPYSRERLFDPYYNMTLTFLYLIHLRKHLGANPHDIFSYYGGFGYEGENSFTRSIISASGKYKAILEGR